MTADPSCAAAPDADGASPASAGPGPAVVVAWSWRRGPSTEHAAETVAAAGTPPTVAVLGGAVRLPAVRCGPAAPLRIDVGVRSFTFASALAAAPPPWRTAAAADSTGPTGSRAAPVPTAPAAPPASRTRLRPPGDVIKLEDRLRYVLQPPLETIVAAGRLDFPATPFPYQYEGVAFLYPRYAAVLADEMGLGKTMQAITAIRLLLHGGEARRVLLVCPKPLVTNWQREFSRWAPEVPLSIIAGDQARRRWLWGQADAPVAIANYELLQRDRDTLADAAGHFDLVVLDEAQRIKNRASATADVVCRLPRTRSWALTGTPVENRPEDLVGIFDFVAPGLLRADMPPRRLGRLAADHVLRRTKDKVLADLPPKLVRDAAVELLPEQRESYRLAEEEGVLRLTALGDGATIQHVFELVLRLKQICNFDPATGESAKLEQLEADLEEITASGRKAVVFSQWVETLQRLARRLRRFGPLEYHGRVPGRARDGVLTRFRDDPLAHVLLLSYGAGGVGLNLQFAGYAFLFDRWWNPAVEDQAMNRVHRIGAAGPVTVTRFLSLETIEQRIDQVLTEKRELFQTIFSDVEPRADLGLSAAEIFGLFRLPCPAPHRRAA